MSKSKKLLFLLLSFLMSTGLQAKSLDQAKLHEDVSLCNPPGFAADEKFRKQLNNFEIILNTNSMSIGQKNPELSSTEAVSSQSNPNLLCKCRLIYNDSNGYKRPVTTQSFQDAVSDKNETLQQSCARVNGEPPSIGIPKHIYYSWEGYECKPRVEKEVSPNPEDDIIVSPGSRILVEKPGWVRGQKKDQRESKVVKTKSPEPKLENKPKYLCKCELLRYDSEGSKRMKLGYDSITYENGSGSCSSANDPAPESWNRAVYYSWSGYDCRSYPLSEY